MSSCLLPFCCALWSSSFGFGSVAIGCLVLELSKSSIKFSVPSIWYDNRGFFIDQLTPPPLLLLETELFCNVRHTTDRHTEQHVQMVCFYVLLCVATWRSPKGEPLQNKIFFLVRGEGQQTTSHVYASHIFLDPLRESISIVVVLEANWESQSGMNVHSQFK